jgi:Na+/proline symporter
MESDTIWILLGLLAGSIYMLPTIFAFNKGHRNRWVIMIINIVFGLTLLGWLIAIIWAFNKLDSPKKGGTKFQSNDPSL